MDLQNLRDTLRRRPFAPFRLFVTDGATYDVHHPELCVPGHRSIFLGLTESEPSEPVFDRFAIVDLVHITRLEPLPASSAKGNGAAS